MLKRCQPVLRSRRVLSLLLAISTSRLLPLSIALRHRTHILLPRSRPFSAPLFFRAWEASLSFFLPSWTWLLRLCHFSDPFVFFFQLHVALSGRNNISSCFVSSIFRHFMVFLDYVILQLYVYSSTTGCLVGLGTPFPSLSDLRDIHLVIDFSSPCHGYCGCPQPSFFTHNPWSVYTVRRW